uniref:Protein SMG8 n=1 Tax=Macrostomum lignano TaxID=282301 RepID=A0A1I8IBK7_9PLAT
MRTEVDQQQLRLPHINGNGVGARAVTFPVQASWGGSKEQMALTLLPVPPGSGSGGGRASSSASANGKGGGAAPMASWALSPPKRASLYPEIYFVGPNVKKRQAMPGGPNNCGFDDEQGSYQHVAHDHIAYRYEVLKI